jgi:hypothetical protein
MLALQLDKKLDNAYMAIAKGGDLSERGISNVATTYPVITRHQFKTWRKYIRSEKDFHQAITEDLFSKRKNGHLYCEKGKVYKVSQATRTLLDKFFDIDEELWEIYKDMFGMEGEGWSKYNSRTSWVCIPLTRPHAYHVENTSYLELITNYKVEGYRQ